MGLTDQSPATCPTCAEPVGPTDRFCEGCGADLLGNRTPVGGPVSPRGKECVAGGATETAILKSSFVC